MLQDFPAVYRSYALFKDIKPFVWLGLNALPPAESGREGGPLRTFHEY